MGLCASKSDKSKPTEPSNPVKPQIRKIREPPSKADQNKGSSLRAGPGHRVDSEADTNKDKLSAQEAARLAAEKRLQESNAKETQGVLGKKLAEERSKSHKTHMMKEVEKRQLEKANNDIVYD